MGEYGVTDDLSIEDAGEAVYYTILLHTGVGARCFLVASAPGHNAGDGVVVAQCGSVRMVE